MPRRFAVIDGADRGHNFPLPDEGTVLIGSHPKHADVCLHDLYVARVHCEVTFAGPRVTVKDNLSPSGMLVNGQKVAESELHPGDVLRVGNSHLRMEEGDYQAAAAKEREPESSAESEPQEETPQPKELPHLPLAKLDRLTGHVISHFEIGQLLGRGYSAVVFQAHDLKSDQDVALRVLPPEFPHDERERLTFVNAFKKRMGLRHPHLVTVLGAGKTGPYTWIAKELIEGESAASAIERVAGKSKIKWPRGLHLALDITRALVYLHEHHLVHGDLVPQNVLIQDSDKTARLNDLMYSRALQGSRLAQETREQKLLTDLAYRAPEQTEPNSYVDDLSDQYNLGAIVYARLTGRAPFTGDSEEEIFDKIRTEAPPKPRELQPSIPDRLQAIVLRMMAKHQEDRYPSPNNLLADLERLAASQEAES